MEDQQGEQGNYENYTDAPYADSQMQPLDSVEWTASEYVAHQKNGNWFAVLFGGAVAITLIVFLVTHSLISTFVVLASFAAFGVLAVRKPATKTYKITPDGVYIDDKLFRFEIFKSFSVMNEGAKDCVWLRPIKKVSPTVAMYYPPNDEDRILMMLENFLPLEDREHDLVDKLSRRFRF